MKAQRISLIVAALLVLGVCASTGCNLVLGIHELTESSSNVDAGSPCDSEAQCDDQNACTVDTCSAGTCSNVEQPDGPAPTSAQVAFDCKVVTCAGGVEKEQNDNSDILIDAEDCTIDTCSNGMAFHTAKVDDIACTSPFGDGVCKSGKCAPTCTVDAMCEDNEPCTLDSCDVGQGICSFTPLNGVIPPGVAQTDGDCNVQICVNGFLKNSADDSDTNKTASDCDTEVCAAGVVKNASLAIDVSCGANKQGYCDGAGSCVECNSPAQCQGFDNDCQARTCTAHVCGINYSPLHTQRAAPFQSIGDCHVVVCDGMGNSSAPDDVDDTDKPVDGNLCTKDLCNNGTPTNPFEPANTACGVNGACNATGLCGCANDTACTAPNTCGGGNPGTPFFCGCTNKTCSMLGKTCGTVTDGCFGTQNCNSGAKDGSETDVDCGGSAAGCGTKCAIAKKCNANSDCGSDYCADGVCCNTACNGTCVACTAAKKGGGADGICGSIAVGLEDTNATTTCTSPKACDGANGCKKVNGQLCIMSAECVSNSCLDGACCGSASCPTCQSCGLSGNGTCTNIGLEQPDNSPVNACSGTLLCNGNGSCLLGSGQPCNTNSECASGSCNGSPKACAAT